MSLFESLDERLRRRRLEAQQNIQNAMLMNQRAASTPAEQAGTGIGNLLGALGAKYFIGDEQPTEKDLEMERVRQGLFSGAQQNEVTPDGGMRSVPREMSLVDDYNYRANKFFDYAQKYGDKDAFTMGLKFKELALEEAQSKRELATKLTPRQKFRQEFYIANPYAPPQDLALAEANVFGDKTQQTGMGVVPPKPKQEAKAEAPKAEQPKADSEGIMDTISGVAGDVAGAVAGTDTFGKAVDYTSREIIPFVVEDIPAALKDIYGNTSGTDVAKIASTGKGVVGMAVNALTPDEEDPRSWYQRAIDATSNALTTIDDYFTNDTTQGGSRFNFDAWMQSKGIDKTQLTQEELRNLYMQARNEYKREFTNKVRGTARGAVNSVLPTRD
jgi:hypothetical protein